ncbi:phenylacetic acid degradation protein [Acinetobacter venetianus]|uniref:PaaI family thioesterase n=1 Tax=Acinetobacter venetianus TaxID=52133 RepID=UPI0007756FB1|nr:PaaI family thioesterase [Acinetobacter venetianus]KXO76915.1 phenylacetic acid degradation protein [Acinetobacter venetianus]
MNPLEMTGLEIMQAFAQGLVPEPGIAKTMPMKPLEVEHGRIVFSATADERHTNPLGGVHGGFAATVLDSVTGCATHTVLAAGEGYGTTDLNVKMCRPLPFNKQLIAEGKVINAGRNLVISEGYIRDEEGKLYAHATATNMIIRR